MIREANNDNIQKVLNYIGKEYFKCLYLYLDLNQYGTNSDFVRLYVQEHLGNYTFVALKYHTALHIYSKSCNFDVKEMVELVENVKPTILCAEKRIIEILKPELSQKGYQSEIGHIGKMEYPKAIDYTVKIERACLNDIDSIAELLYGDDDIGVSYSLDDLKKQIYERLDSGFSRSYVIKEDDKVICHAGTGAEITGVSTFAYLITEKNHRGKGLASQIVNYTCNELRKEGFEVYSVYYPENSRRLHHKLGFIDVCDFGKLYLNNH